VFVVGLWLFPRRDRPKAGEETPKGAAEKTA
jgi:hypothetical protein